ncbi:MAG: hypothetical protein IPM06_19220 [Rhizobiales bacterium]|nr:hypothetical protein [Hyphomicrobiales bacterium]
MSGKTAYFEAAIQKLVFQAIGIANIADNAAASPVSTLYLSLHTADPTDTPATEQSQNETTYTGYARVAVARSAAGWSIVGSAISPVANVDFPACTAGTATITHFGIGTLASGNGKLLYVGGVTPAIAVAAGVTPRLTPATTITEY